MLEGLLIRWPHSYYRPKPLYRKYSFQMQFPYALYIRAGHDGTGTRRAVTTIVTGLRWNAVQEPLVLRGGFRNEFIGQCEELGMLMAAGLEAGIF